MLVDAAKADRRLFARTFDTCVIGTGPAGMTVARKLAALGYSVALMEGGGLAGSAESQELYQGEVVGLDYYDLDATRLRMFGGSSGHWGGRCRELDALSFEALAHEPMRAWPISKSDLDPYAAETDAIMELPPASDDQPLMQKTERFRRVEFRQSSPVAFGVWFEEEIAASSQILCAYNANLVDLRLDEASLREVTEVVFRTFDPSDPSFSIRARAFCLCLGGLENPRMLLNCRSQKPAGVGNDHDLVGRFFCEHLHLRLGDLFFADPEAEAKLLGEDQPSYVPTRAFLDRHEVLSFALFAFPRVEEPLRLPKELARAAVCAPPFAADVAAMLGGEVDCDAGGLRNYFAQPGGRHASRAHVRIRTEQSLVRDSRVTLAEARDALGLQRIRLDWRVGDIDRRTARVAALELGAHYAEQGSGRLPLMD